MESGYKFLTTLPSLKKLSLAGNDLKNKNSYAHLESLQIKLEELILDNCKLYREANFSNFISLSFLSLRNMSKFVKENILKGSNIFPSQLEFLDLSGNDLTDSELNKIL
mmetsp:Transcript_41652/g.37049  ORF Transcript_41652/g.37049 Transcript_41652/m.37049 type:complete len:109 (-) Transcript_41652:162-488(-)